MGGKRVGDRRGCFLLLPHDSGKDAGTTECHHPPEPQGHRQDDGPRAAEGAVALQGRNPGPHLLHRRRDTDHTGDSGISNLFWLEMNGLNEIEVLPCITPLPGKFQEEQLRPSPHLRCGEGSRHLRCEEDGGKQEAGGDERLVQRGGEPCAPRCGDPDILRKTCGREGVGVSIHQGPLKMEAWDSNVRVVQAEINRLKRDRILEWHIMHPENTRIHESRSVLSGFLGLLLDGFGKMLSRMRQANFFFPQSACLRAQPS